MHYVICVSGFSNAGKDEAVSHLVKNHSAIQTGLADRGKRHMADAYGFTEQQLFGPSHFRNVGDVRIPKNFFYDSNLQKWTKTLPEGHDYKGKNLDPNKRYWHYGNSYFVPEGDPEFWLSPREALQQYLEHMNKLDIYTWIRKGMEDHFCLANGNGGYNRMFGIVRGNDIRFNLTKSFSPEAITRITCFADFRHIPEIQYVKQLAEKSLIPFVPILIRIKRHGIETPPYNHRSEMEQIKIRDAAFDVIIQNDRDIPSLHQKMEDVIKRAMRGDIPKNPWRDDYLVPNRKPEDGYPA